VEIFQHESCCAACKTLFVHMAPPHRDISCRTWQRRCAGEERKTYI
jgi:hypothetical protein